MNTVTVTKQFADDFNVWAADRLASGTFTKAEIDDFKSMLRTDFKAGPDQLRAGYETITAAGVAIPAAIDDNAERFRVWAVYFASEAEAITTSRKTK